MRVALIHDYLNQYGGGERVLEVLMEMFPEAPIYTLLYDPEKTFGKFMNREVKTSILDFPEARKNHRPFIPLMPVAMKTLSIDGDYDLIISDTAGFAKGIGIKSNIKHISYVHTPLRYAWEQETYLNGLISHFLFLISKPILNWLRDWDYKAGQKPDVLLANSQFIAGKIKNYYNRNASVIYPPVDTKKF
ncbi:MAG: glycosyltransferase, partial [Patescibacteria group bacterium]